MSGYGTNAKYLVKKWERIDDYDCLVEGFFGKLPTIYLDIDLYDDCRRPIDYQSGIYFHLSSEDQIITLHLNANRYCGRPYHEEIIIRDNKTGEEKKYKLVEISEKEERKANDFSHYIEESIYGESAPELTHDYYGNKMEEAQYKNVLIKPLRFPDGQTPTTRKEQFEEYMAQEYCQDDSEQKKAD